MVMPFAPKPWWMPWWLWHYRRQAACPHKNVETSWCGFSEYDSSWCEDCGKVWYP